MKEKFLVFEENFQDEKEKMIPHLKQNWFNLIMLKIQIQLNYYI